MTTVRASPQSILDEGRGVGQARNNKDLLTPLTNWCRPFLLIFLLYGIVPLRLNKRMSLSLHPVKSSLLYMVLVQAAVALSADAVVSKHFKVINRDASSAAAVDSQLLAALSVVHVSSHLIMLLVWLELPFVHRRLGAWGSFSCEHRHMFSEVRLCALTRSLPWIVVVFAFVLAPVLVQIWSTFMAPDEVWYVHSWAHLYQCVFIFTASLFMCQWCLVVSDLAATLSRRMRQETATLRVSAGRLEEYRLAWLSMRRLTGSLGALPLSAMGVLAYHLVMITLSAYQAVVAFSNGYSMFFVCNFTLFVMFEGTLLAVCDAAHRLTEEMSTGFYEALEVRAWREMPEELRTENQQFLQTISENGPKVTLAGFITITRATFLSVNSAIATYLIVLFQLRQADDVDSSAPQNASAIAQSIDSHLP